MDKQKEIEKMEKDIGDCVGLTYEGERFTYTLHTQKYLAKELIERGYGDTKAAGKEAVKEFVERLREKEISVKIGNEWKAVVTNEDIDELVKEICGNENI